MNASDNEMLNFASSFFGYSRNKGLDFIARINGRYILGEAKFLSDFGGHQNAQFADAISTIEALNKLEVIPVAILDGVLYIKGNNKMYKDITSTYAHYNILSSLILREFLYSL